MGLFHTHAWKIVSVAHVPRATHVKVEGGEFSGPGYMYKEFMEDRQRMVEEMAAGKTILGMRCQTCGDFKTETHLGIHEIKPDPA